MNASDTLGSEPIRTTPGGFSSNDRMVDFCLTELECAAHMLQHASLAADAATRADSAQLAQAIYYKVLCALPGLALTVEQQHLFDIQCARVRARMSEERRA